MLDVTNLGKNSINRYQKSSSLKKRNLMTCPFPKNNYLREKVFKYLMIR